jgi:ATP-binding cassette subfamily B protein
VTAAIAAQAADTDHEKRSADLTVIGRFLPYLWPKNRPDLRLRVAVSLFLVLLAKATTLSMPFFYKGAIDRLAGGRRDEVVLAAALVLSYAAARFGGVLFDNLRNALFERVGQTAAGALGSDVFAHVQRLSLRYHLERRTGELTRIFDRGTKSIDEMLYFIFFNIAPTAIELFAVCIIFGLKMGVTVVIATLVMVAAYVAFTQWVTDQRNKARREMTDADNKQSGRAVDALLNYETVKYFNAEKREEDNYRRALGRYVKLAERLQVSLSWLNIGQSAITNLMLGAGMAYVVWGWSKGRFTTGDVVLINTLLTQLFRPLDFLGVVYRQIRQGLIDMEHMFRLLDTNAEIADKPGAPALQVRGGHVRFENVDFSYEPRRQILHGVSFEIPPGKTVAVVGASGAGKSTLSRILFRFYDIAGGRVTIDGQDIREVTQESLRRAIGIVPQDTVLFNDTIGYNIGYGREGAPQAEIERAAAQAQVHDFVARLPDGYQSMVGERGLKLSGGEKQRVAIARTILKDPAVLILDEATSALDSRTEADIQSALRGVARGRTTLVIAHRLSTIADADEILVMDAGRIVERGTHGALLARNGQYARMWALQQAEAEAEREAA